MLEKTDGIDFCGVSRNTQRISFNLEIMLCGFPSEKNTYGQIQEKMVWPIQGIILFTQQHNSSFFC
jgi:hypothetical protein